MRLILFSLLLSLDMAINQKVQNDRGNPYHAFSGEHKSKGNAARIHQPPLFRNSSENFHHKKNSASSRVPPYAVLMEPLVQYSQPDPLFKESDSSESKIAEPKSSPTTDKINKIEKREHKQGNAASSKSSPYFGDNDHESTQNAEFSSFGGSYYEGPYQEEPEPIIEIIIKESNQTVAPPVPVYKPPPKKKKEPVQVFYVKYKKDPSAGYGEDKIIYEAPIPAVTPPTNNNHESSGEETEDEHAYETREVATLPPAPSTTLKAIIRPDSEIYHGAGLHITFGESKSQAESSFRHRESQEEQSAPPASVALPDRNAIHLTSRSGSETPITKRQHGPFHAAPPVRNDFSGGTAYRPPVAPATFQQTPQFPAQPFKPAGHHPNLNNQYSTLPLHLRNPNFQIPINPPRHVQDSHPVPNYQFRPEHQNAVFPSRPEPYQTIKHVDHQNNRYFPTTPPPSPAFPPVQPPPAQSFGSPDNRFRPPTFDNGQASGAGTRPGSHNSADQQQHLQRVEQLNRLQQEQARLVAQLSERNKGFNVPKQQQQQQQQQEPAVEIIKSTSPDEVVYSNHRSVVGRPSSVPAVSRRPDLVPTTTTTTTTTQIPREYVDSSDKKKKKEEEEKKKKQNVAALPKEVPDDLREQLLSSGILNNADIQILDYDKIGDIPVENLPPEALANFQAVAGSEPVPAVASAYKRYEDALPSASERRNVVVQSDRKGTNKMEMKVVRFNPESNDGSRIADKYMKEGATRLEPVVLNDSKYNRYLPLKISGTQFPVPDVPELKGRNVTSVVILAPVDYEFLERKEKEDEARLGRRSAGPLLEVQGVHFVAGDVLKDLVKIPNTENYRKWLDKENRTAIEKQSVVLLVVEPAKKSKNEAKDIFMYDIATQRINKLKGELSSTFVKVAESNSQNRDLEEISDNPSAPGGDFTIKNTSEIPP